MGSIHDIDPDSTKQKYPDLKTGLQRKTILPRCTAVPISSLALPAVGPPHHHRPTSAIPTADHQSRVPWVRDGLELRHLLRRQLGPPLRQEENEKLRGGEIAGMRLLAGMQYLRSEDHEDG